MADLAFAAGAKLNARLGAQALTEQLDEVLGGRMVELVASLVRRQVEVVQRQWRASPAAQRHRHAALEVDGQVRRFFGREAGMDGPGVRILGWLVPWVFEHARLDAAAPQVGVD